MKNLFKNSVKLFAFSMAVLVMASCGKDEEEVVLPAGPTITLISSQLGASSYEATAGDTISFSVNVTAPGGFNTYSAKVGDNELISESRASGETVLSFVSDQTTGILTTEAHVGTTFSLVVTATDDNNKTSTETYDFTVVSVPLNTFSSFMLAAPLGNFEAKSFFSTNTGAQYSPDSVTSSASPLSNDIDFGYYYGSTNLATIASPAGFDGSAFSAQVANWGTKNSTTLKATTLGESDFNEVTTMSALTTAFDAGTDASEFKTNLTVGDVIAFQTSSTKTNSPSKKGLILIKAINGTFNENDNIEIEVVVEK